MIISEGAIQNLRNCQSGEDQGFILHIVTYILVDKGTYETVT